MMYQDRTGMIFLDFQGRFGTISNIVLALGKFQKLLNIQSEAAGWYTRGMGSLITLKYIQTSTEKVTSHPLLWRVIQQLIILVFGTAVLWVLYIALTNQPHPIK
jgi:hypothetical protein